MFVDAVTRCAELSGALQSGLSALGNNSARIDPDDPRLCEGSIDIDGHLQRLYASDSRWDYALGYSGRTYFVEIHSATTGQVSAVLDKLAWVCGWLRQKARSLNDEPKSFHWVPSGKYAILPGSRQALRIAKSGITIEHKVFHLP